jgi:hypothetical protein
MHTLGRLPEGCGQVQCLAVYGFNWGSTGQVLNSPTDRARSLCSAQERLAPSPPRPSPPRRVASVMTPSSALIAHAMGSVLLPRPASSAACRCHISSAVVSISSAVVSLVVSCHILFRVTERRQLHLKDMGGQGRGQGRGPTASAVSQWRVQPVSQSVSQSWPVVVGREGRGGKVLMDFLYSRV